MLQQFNSRTSTLWLLSDINSCLHKIRSAHPQLSTLFRNFAAPLSDLITVQNGVLAYTVLLQRANRFALPR